MQKLYAAIVVSCFIFLLQSCKSKATLFTLNNHSGINFNNKIAETKNFNVFNYRNFYNGGGVATGDLNNDGLPEVFFTANQGANKLFLNKGQFKFEDISTKAGFGEKQQWSTGVVFVDINNDKWLDIYVCNAGSILDSTLRRNQLFINNHDLTFTEQAAKYGLDDDGYTTQASFFDYDMDGDLDCFLVNNSPIPVNTLNYANKREVLGKDWDLPKFLQGGGDRLYQNNAGKFLDVTQKAGLHGGLIGLGLGVTVGDVNNDHYPDVYVSNDFFERDYLYVNQKNGSFRDEYEQRVQHGSLSSMGADMQDINNDGRMDIFTTDMLPDDDYRLKANTSFEGYDVFNLKKKSGFHQQFTQNAMLVNTPEGNFLETAFYSGVAASDWSWGAMIFDADNDGWQDIYVCNGIYRDVTDQDFIEFFGNDIVREMTATGKKAPINELMDRMPSNPIADKVFRNKGNLKFDDAGLEWGITTKSFSNGAIYNDLDNDGDLDVIVNTVNQPALIYENNAQQIAQQKYIQLQLQYNDSNYFAIGSTILVYQKDKVIARQVIPSRGFQSSMDYKQTIGLGAAAFDSIKIIWPNGMQQKLGTLPLNKLHTIVYNLQATSAAIEFNQAGNTLLDSFSNPFAIHQEDDVVDYYAEKAMPFMLSRQGPKTAVADVNGDGLEDLFVGGARQQASQLYLQTANGFALKEVADFKTFAFNDITAALFFDADNDGDPDLFAGGGGNFAAADNASYQNLLYINDGKGNFLLKRGALPLLNANCAQAIALDYNKDGLQDLCIANRSVPQVYGMPASSYLLKNTGSGFEDVTKQVAPALQGIGMITSLSFLPETKNAQAALVFVGEWMAPRLLEWNGNQFAEKPVAIFNDMQGMWQSSQAQDLDGDGDMDLILGNMGENQYLYQNNAVPYKLWVNDFDDNGMMDKVISKTVNGKEVPLFTKRELTDQVPSLKKMNLKNAEYARKSMADIFPAKIKTTNSYIYSYSSSCIAWNTGNNSFTIMALPWQVQLSSVNAIKCVDVNKDGKLDIVLGGNMFDMLPQFCRIDASFGHVLLARGQQQFEWLSPLQSGLFCTGQIKDIQVIRKANTSTVLLFPNNEKPQSYRIK